jgi:hypothetical protein
MILSYKSEMGRVYKRKGLTIPSIMKLVERLRIRWEVAVRMDKDS